MPFGFAVCDHAAVCFGDWPVSENVSISDCLPDGPNDTRKIFQIVGSKDTAAGHFRKFLQVMSPAPLCGPDVFLPRKLEVQLVHRRVFIFATAQRSAYDISP